MAGQPAEGQLSQSLQKSYTQLGYQTTTGVGRTGVVGILRNGQGPTALLRADMDGLPVAEQTGLAYASGAHGVDPDGHEVPVMHACGHDMHVTCLIGACQALAENRAAWSGTLMAVFQPAEEVGAGARAMIDDGLIADSVLPVGAGFHVAGRHRTTGSGHCGQPRQAGWTVRHASLGLVADGTARSGSAAGAVHRLRHALFRPARPAGCDLASRPGRS
jgi:metal-dependent amidase/aminoacylase/carboxypeptidase family protein